MDYLKNIWIDMKGWDKKKKIFACAVVAIIIIALIQGA
jgi:hypothetical protein